MTNHIVDTAIQSVIERPEFLNKISSRSTGKKKMAILKIAETLKKIKKTQCLKFSSVEFEKEFGPAKTAKAYFVVTLKSFGIKKPRIIFDQGTCYIWVNDDDL